MKILRSLGVFALVAASAGVASASPITLLSYGSTASAPAGAGNSATSLLEGFSSNGTPIGGSTYDIGTGNVWSTPVGNSSWVSQNAGNYPGGSSVEPTGSYWYYSSFTDTTPGSSSGSITILADDTASVYLNGTLIAAAASSATAGTCDSSTPNCTVPATYTLTGFTTGTNYLYFDVLQEHGSAEGLDYSGTVSTSVTPEPNSLLLLGPGLLAMAGFVYHRRTAMNS